MKAMTLPSLLVTALSFAAVGSACTYEVIEGSGESATEVREVPSFKAITNASLLDVELTVGVEQTVEITCDDNLLDYLRSKVEEGELKLYQPQVIDEPNHFVELEPHTDCRAVITTPMLIEARNTGSGELVAAGELDALTEIEATGSGDASLADIDVTKLQVEVSGSGDVTLAGQATLLELNVSGSGRCKAKELAVHDATVEVSGSGDVQIAASGDLDVTISGSGDVYVYGRPDSLHVSTPGSGHVIFR